MNTEHVQEDDYAPLVQKSSNTVLKVVLIILLVLSQMYFFKESSVPGPYDPLGDYPVQQVLNTLPGVEEPALRVGDLVIVRGTKCNDSSEPVTVEGSSSWNSVEPPGSTLAKGSGIGTRDPGCVEKRYENVVPPEVIERSNFFFGQGKEYVVWRINGVEIPVGEANGVSRSWTTVNFRIYPQAP